MLSPEGELKAQSMCYFFNSPLISDDIAWRRYDCGLPSVSVVLANLDFYLSNTKRGNDQVG